MRRLFALTLLLAVTLAQAQSFPSRPIRFLVGFPPGGSTDVAARTLAPVLAERLGQPVVVENRTGAGGVLAADLVAKATPDGYTVGIGVSGALTVNALLMKLPYDPQKDFAFLSLFATNPMILVASPALNATNVNELLARSRAEGGKPMPFGTPGNGTAMHLAGELLKQLTGLPLEHVAYKGGGPASQDVIGGQIPLALVDVATVRPFLSSGRVKAIGMTGGRRSPVAPDVPTIAEGGVAGYDVASWFGIVAPVGTPADVVKRLNADIVASLGVADVRDRMLAAGLEATPSTSQEFAERVRRETTRWAEVIKAAGIKPQP